MLSKTLYSGPAGSVSVGENGGVVSLAASISLGAGGGAAKGFASLGASVSISLKAEQIADMGLDIAAAKFPALSVEIALVKAALDEELAKL